jgi:hypothetical protein
VDLGLAWPELLAAPTLVTKDHVLFRVLDLERRTHTPPTPSTWMWSGRMRISPRSVRAGYLIAKLYSEALFPEEQQNIRSNYGCAIGRDVVAGGPEG